jgi:hypothetical protein
MDRENTDPFCLDPIDPPPEVTNAADIMLWQGLCPWCGTKGPFAPHQLPDTDVAAAPPRDSSLLCRTCGLEFLGPMDDQSGQPPQRTVTAVYVEGDVGMKIAAADSLPAVSARP